MIGNWVTKITAKKSKMLVRFFQSRFSSPNHSHTPTTLPHCNHHRTLDGRWKSHRKNWKRCIFENLPIVIAGPSNSRYWIFVKHFWEFTHRNNRIRGSHDYAGRGLTKITAEKIENIGRVLKKNVLSVDETSRLASRQTSSRWALPLHRLGGWLAVWTHLEQKSVPALVPCWYSFSVILQAACYSYMKQKTVCVQLTASAWTKLL